jgi:hypothetical protein
MHVVGTFVRLSRFHLDPRFERDYVAIYESWDGPPDWPAMWRGSERIPPAIGDYVRRDAIRDDPETLRGLRQVYHQHSMQDSVGPWQERREGFGIQRPLTARAAAQVYEYVVQR